MPKAVVTPVQTTNVSISAAVRSRIAKDVLEMAAAPIVNSAT